MHRQINYKNNMYVKALSDLVMIFLTTAKWLLLSIEYFQCVCHTSAIKRQLQMTRSRSVY